MCIYMYIHIYIYIYRHRDLFGATLVRDPLIFFSFFFDPEGLSYKFLVFLIRRWTHFTPHYKLIHPYLALFMDTFCQTKLDKGIQTYNEGAPKHPYGLY